jgi:hypothetical protein
MSMDEVPKYVSSENWNRPKSIQALLFWNYLNNLFDNVHMQIKIYWEFYHGIIYIANEGHHIRIVELFIIIIIVIY